MKPSICIGGNFEALVLKSTIFVDKSLFIKEVLEDSAIVLLITMPRRWGKSLNLDMLRRFLAIQVNGEGEIIAPSETESYRLFAGGSITLDDGDTKVLGKLKIADESCFTKYQGRRPVIYLNLKDCKAQNFEKIKSAVCSKISRLLLDFDYLGKSQKIFKNQITISERYNELLQSTEFETALLHLSELLYLYHGVRVWVLIDEYDAAANLAYREFDEGEAAKVASLFRSVFEPAFKDNEFLEKAVLTGVQYIVKSGMLSGLNNLAKYSVQSYKYAPYYGVNQPEMQLLLDHFAVPQDKRLKIKEWYNGYLEPTIDPDKHVEKYNIWSVANYLCNQPEGFKSYWEKSGSIDFLDQLFSRPEVKDKIIELVDGEAIFFNLSVDFSIDNFRALKKITNLGSNDVVEDYGLDILFSYLFIGGYLTKVNDGEYRFPNKEIRYEMGQKILAHYRTIYRMDQKKLFGLTRILQELFDKTHSLAQCHGMNDEGPLCIIFPEKQYF
jgi:hypothetical protein